MSCLHPSMLAEWSFALFTLRAPVVFSNSCLLRISFLFFPCHTLPQFNKAGLLAWVHTCYFYLRVVGRVEPHSTLVYSLLRGDAVFVVASSVTVQGVSLPPSLHCSLLGCVAATLIPLRISLGCVEATLIAYTLWGVLLPPLFYSRVHPTSFSPIYCQRLCVFYLGLHS